MTYCITKPYKPLNSKLNLQGNLKELRDTYCCNFDICIFQSVSFIAYEKIKLDLT